MRCSRIRTIEQQFADRRCEYEGAFRPAFIKNKIEANLIRPFRNGFTFEK